MNDLWDRLDQLVRDGMLERQLYAWGPVERDGGRYVRAFTGGHTTLGETGLLVLTVHAVAPEAELLTTPLKELAEKMVEVAAAAYQKMAKTDGSLIRLTEEQVQRMANGPLTLGNG